MSKKRFTDGLESLFGAPETPADERVLIVEKHEERADRAAAARKPKKRSRKNFTSDLDSLFEEVTSTIVEAVETAPEPPRRAGGRAPKRPVAPTGLDALIRRTVEERMDSTDRERKRLTLTLDRQKVMKLKSIARHEKAYLRDIVGELVAKYIKKYERQNGDVAGLN